MSTRMTLRPQIVIPSPQGSPVNGSSMAGNITSAPTILGSLTKCSYAFSWSGTSPVGTIIVQVSNDFALGPEGANQAPTNAGTWTTIAFNSNGTTVTSFPVSGNTGTGFLEITTSAYAIRTVFTFTSGTGTLTAVITGKVS